MANKPAPVTDAEAQKMQQELEWLLSQEREAKLPGIVDNFTLRLLHDRTRDKERITELEAGLRALHDNADDMNAEFAQPGRYCVLCRTDSYDAEEGVIHREGCVLRKARALLEVQDEDQN